MRRLLLAALCAPALLAPAAAAQSPLERAREELGIERPLPQRWPLANGDLEVSPSELPATAAGARIRFTVRLERPRPGGSLSIALPGTHRGRSGLPGLRAPERLTIRFAGDRLEHAAEIEHVGLAAGTYELPLTWDDGRSAGTARLRVLAPARESEREPPDHWRGVDVSADAAPQSEAFSAVVPGDPDRIVTASNPGATTATLPAWLSTDRGETWSRNDLPETLDVPGTGTPEPAAICCDPMLAAAPSGDVWVGAITEPDGPPGSRSRVVVNRLPGAGRPGFAPLSVGLPARTAGTQDKPMMTVDPAGRLLVVWLEPDTSDPGALNVVLTACDTALGPEADRGSWCEDADHWALPVTVTPVPGSYTYPDVAAAPDGTVHVVWWDFSAMANGVRGATCPAPCAGAFEPSRTIALLDGTGGRPLPFACPILVAPGGRSGAAPSVETGPDGRVWVAWADLRAQSGSTRCEETPTGLYTAPRATHLSWDAFAAEAEGELPGAALPSAEAGTRLLVDGEEGVAASSDDFLPWLAIDPVHGEAWASAYSTGHDPTRQSAHYVAMSLAPDGAGGLFVGPANRVSSAPSGFPTARCCTLGNDFGDYAGLAVTDRVVVPAWIDNGAAGDADLWAAATPLPTVGFDLETAELAEHAGDGDGEVDPGETAALRVGLRNTGTRTAVRPEGTLEGNGVVAGRSLWPTLAPGATGTAERPFEIAVDSCDAPIETRLTVRSPLGAEALPLAMLCSGEPAPPPAPPEPAPQPPQPQPEPVPQPRPSAPRRALLAFSVVPGQDLPTVLRRGLLVSARCARACRATVTADLPARTARSLAVRRRIAFAAATFGPSPRRIRMPVRARARRLLARRASARLRVRIFAFGISRDQPHRRTVRVTVTR